MFTKSKLGGHGMKTIFGFLILILVTLGINGYAEEQTTVTEIYKKAQKEGKTVFYASMELPVAQSLADKFGEKYPGVKVEVYRAGSERLLDKAIAEGAAGKHLFDIIQLSVQKISALQKSKLLAKYKPSSYQFYPAGFIDQESCWTGIYHNPCTIAYNTKLIKANELPQTWEELLDPKWKGKLAMDSTKPEWSMALREIMGEERGVKFLKDLSMQKINFRQGMAQAVALMAAGEISIMAYCFISTLDFVKAKGASLDWVRMKSPVPSAINIAAIGEQAPHPNAAKLFYEFILSKSGQELLAANAKTVARSDVEAKNIGDIRKLDLRPDKAITEEEYANGAKLFRSIFGVK